MHSELEIFIENNQEDIIVTGGITDDKINNLEGIQKIWLVRRIHCN